MFFSLFCPFASLQVFDEHVPYGHDVTDTACEDKEVEYGVHVAALVERVKDSTGDVAHPLGDDPYDGCRGDGVDERLEGYEHAQSHADEAEGLEVGMLLELPEADDGARYGTEPYKREEAPAPVALCAQGDEGERRVGACYVPVDGGMVPVPQPLLPFGAWSQQALLPGVALVERQGVVYGRGDIGSEHAEEVEADAQTCPGIVALEGHDEEYNAEGHAQENACGVAPGVPKLLTVRIADGHPNLMTP